MEKFARIIVGYHGCPRSFADAVLLGKAPIAEWQKSQNAYDWLGEGVYFWEHSPNRALRWAQQRYDRPAVVGAVLQLGKCFDLLDESISELLAESYENLVQALAETGRPLPSNVAGAGKLRKLDCLVINDCLNRLAQPALSTGHGNRALWRRFEPRRARICSDRMELGG